MNWFGRATGAFILALSAQAGAQPSSLPAPEELAPIVFQGWGAGAAAVRTVSLPPGKPGRDWSREVEIVRVEPEVVLQTGPEQVTLLVTMVPSDEDGRPMVARYYPAALSAYQFTKDKHGWRLTGRQEGFAYEGENGEAMIAPVALSGTRQGIKVRWGGSCWQGYCGEWTSIYELDGAKVNPVPILDAALDWGDNTPAHDDCLWRLGREPKPLPGSDSASDDDYSASHNCFDIESTSTITPSARPPGDLTIHFKGTISRRDAWHQPPVQIDQRMVLRYIDGKYQVISGENPIPEF